MIQKLNLIRNRTIFLVALIILIGLLLRLWNFHNLFYFAIDEEKAAYIIKGIINAAHFPTVGYPSSIGFRLGSLLYYLISPIYKIFGPNPVNWGFFSVFLSIISMILIYKIGSKINRNTGIIALILYSFSYLNILYDRRGWQVSFHSLIALLILYSLLKIKNGNQKYLYILTFSLIGATHFEVATLLFLPLVFIAWIIFRIQAPRKIVSICLLLFFVSQTGLIIFDLRHNFLNTKYLLNYFRPDTKERIVKNIPLSGTRKVYLAHNLIPATLARTLFFPSLPNVAIQYANCPQYLSFKQNSLPPLLKLLPIILFVMFISETFKKHKEDEEQIVIKKIIIVYFTLLFGGIAVYTYIFQGEMAEYYLLSSFAYFFIMVASVVQGFLRSKYKIIIIFILLLFVMKNSHDMLTSENPYSLKQKMEAVNYSLSIVKSHPFTLESFQTCWYSGGYRYLYTLAGKEPLTSYMDQYLSEYYTPDNLTKPDYLVVILTPELVGKNPSGYDEYRDKIKSTSDFQKNFGAIEVYVKKLSNS